MSPNFYTPEFYVEILIGFVLGMLIYVIFGLNMKINHIASKVHVKDMPSVFWCPVSRSNNSTTSNSTFFRQLEEDNPHSQSPPQPTPSQPLPLAPTIRQR